MTSSRGFRILPSYYDAIRCFPDDQRLILWDAIMDYGCAGVLPENLPPVCNAVFTLMQPTIAKSVKFFMDQQSKAQGRQDALRKSAAIVPNDCRKSADNVSAIVNGTVRDSEGVSECDNEGVSGGDITAAAILQQYGIIGDNDLRETVEGDLKRHNAEIVSEALKRAAKEDFMSGVTAKFYTKHLLDVLKDYRRKPSPAQQGYLTRQLPPSYNDEVTTNIDDDEL